MADTSSFSRKDLKTPDAFFETAGRAQRYVAEHRRTVMGAGAVVVVLLVGGLGSTSYISATKGRDAAAFERARISLDDESFAAARTGLDNLAKSGRGIYGELAGFYAASLALDEDRFDEAAEAYERVAERANTDYLRQAAVNSRGYALEQAGRAGEALAVYREAAAIEGPYRHAALRSQARLAEAQGDAPAARAALERLIELYPGAPDTEALSARLATLGE